MNKKSLLALTVILATGLAACSNKNPDSIKAQAAVAKTPEQKAKTIESADAALKSDIESLESHEIAFDDSLWTKGKAYAFGISTPENRSSIEKSLRAIVENAKTKMELAEAIKDEEKMGDAIVVKARAERLLAQIEADVASERSKAANVDEAKDFELTGP